MKLKNRQTNQEFEQRVPSRSAGGTRSLVLTLVAGTVFVGVWAVWPTRVRVIDTAGVQKEQQTALPTPASTDAEIALDAFAGLEKAGRGSNQEAPPLAAGWACELSELKYLAQQDSNAALDRVRAIAVAEEQQVALREVCLVIATNDPALALDAAWRLQLGHLGGRPETTALEELAYRWAASDLVAAFNWVRNQSLDEHGRLDRVIAGIASVWSQHAPADAARLIAESMSPDYHQFDAAMKLVGQWAAVDFPAASAWVNLFPEGPVKDRGREELSKAISHDQVLPNSP